MCVFVCVCLCVCVCVSAFFSAAAEPFALKFGVVFRNDVGRTAKNFVAHWIPD